MLKIITPNLSSLFRIKEVAQNVQKAIKEKVEELAGVDVREINVVIEKVEKVDEE